MIIVGYLISMPLIRLIYSKERNAKIECKMYTIYKATLDLETILLELDRAYLRKRSKSNFHRQTICLHGTPWKCG